MQRRHSVSSHVLNVAVNLAVPGITLRALSRRLATSMNVTQQVISTLIAQGRIFETHSSKRTTYHAVRVFLNRVAATMKPTALYGHMLEHMSKYAHRRWTLRELAQQLGTTPGELQPELDRGQSGGAVDRSQVGALPLYGLISGPGTFAAAG